MDNAEVLRGPALYEWTDSEMNRRRLEAILDVSTAQQSALHRPSGARRAD